MNKKKIISSLFLTTALVASTIAASTATTFAASSRLGGADRYETSAQISQNGWANGSDYVVLASGEGYADALCAAPIAKKYNAPILLTSSKTLNSTIKSEIKRLKAKNIIEIGGTASISSNIEDQLENDMSLNVTRLGGTDRYETSANVARELGDVSDMVLTSGLGYADALSIAPIAASKGYPILLTPKNSVTNSVKSYIDSHRSDSTKVYVVGGSGVIPESTLSSVPNPMRIFGQNRYETNVSVIEFFKTDLNLDNVYIARGEGPNGNEFADALSASALAAKTNAPVVLTEDDIKDSTQKFIEDNVDASANIVAVGGQASVSDYLLERMELTVIVKAADSRLQAIADATSDSNEKDAIEQIIDNLNNSISTKLDNADEALSNFQSNMEKTQQILQKLSDVERTHLQNQINADQTLMQYLNQLNQIAEKYFPADTE